VTPFQPNSQSVAAGFVLRINRGATVTTVTSSPNPSTVGSLVTFTATVSSTLGAPTGTVSFSDGATSLGSPSLAGSTASIQTSQLAAGTHTITATYSGDPDFAPGSGTVSQVVNAAVSSTTTTITAAPNPAQINQLVFFTISITSAGANTPTGSFELRDGPDLLAIEPIVPGVPTVITSAFGGAGTHSYTAKYLGDPFNAPSQSAPVIVTVLAIATNTTVTGIPNPSVTGQPVVFSARVASATGNPAGNVTFFDSANILGTSAVDAAGNTQFTTSSLGAGVHVITASYDPAPGFASSNSAPWNQTVAQDGIGIIITVAGTGDTTFSGDGGIGTSASIFNPRDLATDSAGNVFIADLGNQRIRRLDATTNLITTVAGNGIAGFSGDGGPATSATLNGPASLAVDAAGSLLFSDLRNQRIRRVDALAGTINTVAGNGTIGLTGDGGLATAATLNDPAGIALDAAGNLFFADADNNVVRRVDGSTGVITTVAGNGLQGATGDGGAATNAALNSPIGVALDANRNLFFVESGNNRIRRVDASSGVISTVAGTGAPGFSGDGGPATSATLSSPIGLAIDAAGNLYVGEQTNARVRRVDASNGTITTVAGNGVQGFAGDGGFATAANLNSPLGVAVDLAGNLYIADKLNNRVRRVRLGFTANTPVGTNLSLVSNGIPFTFANVTSAGSTTVTPISPGSVGPLPPGFSLSGALAFEIHSTATFTGPVTITFVVPRPISAADFGNLQVLHELSTGFEVLPATRNFAALTITATTTSFSPFVVAQSTDVTPPFISCGTPDGLWHANDVTIACTAADSGSGLANAADASFTLSTSVPAGTETANASTNSRTVCDQAGNCAIAGPISGIKVDKKPPAITLTNPAANSSFIVNQSVLASYACADGGSGVASCSGPVASSSAVPTAAAGLFTFTVNATDAVGNASSKSANYGVSYNICLLFDPTKARSVGSKYHFQIQLCDVANRNVSSNSIVVTAISITATGTSALLPLDASDDPDPADLNFNFKPSLGQTGGYEFNLDTNGYRKGTFVLTFKAGADPATHTITFQLR
jgi:sugar lactone lactonase YvrE